MPATPPMDPILRRALAATAVMNLAGSPAFTPAGEGLRAAFGLPAAHPLWPLVVGSFIFAMGLGYAALAVRNRSEPVFVAVAIVGKSSFAGILAATAWQGELPWSTAITGLPDLVFALVFAWRLAATGGGDARPAA